MSELEDDALNTNPTRLPSDGGRRSALATLLALAALPLHRPAGAHHGWSGFDQQRPLYLAGTVRTVRWANPHAEIEIELSPGLELPRDLAARTLPAQTAPVDGKAMLAATTLPRRRDRLWTVELAPLFRMQAWGVEPLRPGEAIELIGFTHRDEQGPATLRAEYLFRQGRVFAFRSSPA